MPTPRYAFKIRLARLGERDEGEIEIHFLWHLLITKWKSDTGPCTLILSPLLSACTQPHFLHVGCISFFLWSSMKNILLLSMDLL